MFGKRLNIPQAQITVQDYFNGLCCAFIDCDETLATVSVVDLSNQLIGNAFPNSTLCSLADVEVVSLAPNSLFYAFSIANGNATTELVDLSGNSIGYIY